MGGEYVTPMGVIGVFVSLPPPSANKAITCALMATWYAYQLGPTESTMQVQFKGGIVRQLNTITVRTITMHVKNILHGVCFYGTWI